VAFHDGIAPVRQPILEEIALIDCRRKVLAAGLNVVDCKVLYRSGEFEVIDVVALQATHIRDRHATRKIWIFAKDLLDASPPRIAADIDDWRTEH
jgi:hypothetical protein